MAIAPRQRTEVLARTPLEPSLRERYESVRRRIADAAKRSGQPGNRLVLVAVAKFASISQIRELIELGHVDFGENRVQTLIQKSAQIEEYLVRQREIGGRRSEPAHRCAGT